MIGTRTARIAVLKRLQSVKAAKASGTKVGDISQFQHEKTGNFNQARPVLHNPFTTDEFLNDYLQRYCPSELYVKIKKDLERFGERIVNEVDSLGIECEEHPPRLQRTDAWGKRVDSIWTTPAWKGQHKVSAEEGLIAIGYESESGAFCRVHQMMKNLLYGASSGLYNCPLAMTDGAAMISRDLQKDYPVLRKAFEHLSSRDPEKFWTSGQWMTEKEGGSDVGAATDTHAILADRHYELFGYKWFTSAITSDMTLTLARIHDSNGEVIPGSRGLSMFFLELRDEKGELNNIQVHKLKNKLGTRQLPTAELNLNGTKASLIGEPGQGIKLISGMLTITRIHNAIAACSFMRRMNHMARDYATKRTVFGAKLEHQLAHVQVLARLDIESRAGILLALEVSRLHGRIEHGEASEHERELMRILTPLAKLVTAKQVVAVCSEGLECFGGQGYIEDTHLPQMLRDAQVLPIWEGTSTVMSLDVLRAIQKSNGNVLSALLLSIREKMSQAGNSKELNCTVSNIQTNVDSLTKYLLSAEKTSQYQLKSARDFSFAIGRVYQAVLLLDHANFTGKKTDFYAAEYFSKTNLVNLHFDYSVEAAQNEYELVFANFPKK